MKKHVQRHHRNIVMFGRRFYHFDKYFFFFFFLIQIPLFMFNPSSFLHLLLEN
jgi:hypothetical protein